MPKAVCAINYLRAIQIMFGEWKSISPSDYCEEDTNDCTILYEHISPEEMIIKKELWKELSEEAKEVIVTIISSPNEVLELLKTPKRKLLTTKSIQKYFSRIWMSKFISETTVEEIRQWVKEL